VNRGVVDQQIVLSDLFVQIYEQLFLFSAFIHDFEFFYLFKIEWNFEHSFDFFEKFEYQRLKRGDMVYSKRKHVFGFRDDEMKIDIVVRLCPIVSDVASKRTLINVFWIFFVLFVQPFQQTLLFLLPLLILFHEKHQPIDSFGQKELLQPGHWVLSIEQKSVRKSETQIVHFF